LDREFDVSSTYQWRTEQVWGQVLCSKVSSATLPGCGLPSPQKYQRDLQLTFAAAVLTAGLLWVAGWRILYLDPAQPGITPTWWSAVPWAPARALMITLLLLTLFGLTYQYGKTVKSTIVPAAELKFEEDASNPSGASPANPQSSSFLVVADDGTSTILYNIDPTKERVWVVRDTAIKSERISSLEDVLKRRIEIHGPQCAKEVPVQ
jgi:hypothetical protein